MANQRGHHVIAVQADHGDLALSGRVSVGFDVQEHRPRAKGFEQSPMMGCLEPLGHPAPLRTLEIVPRLFHFTVIERFS